MTNIVLTVTDPSGAFVSVTGTTSGGGGNTNIGETTILPNADNGNGNLLVSQNITLAQTATIQSLAFYVTTAGGNLRLGIYDATGPGGGPGALKAQTASFTPVVGWNIANVVTQVSLAAGNYWIAYLPSSNTLAFRKSDVSGISGKYYAFTFGALPATFSTSPSSTTSHWSFYAIFSGGQVTVTFPVSPPPDTTAPSAPTNLVATVVSSSQINLAWTASTDNVGVTGYKVFRGGTQVGTPTSTSFNDSGLSASTSYSYTVKAVDAAGNLSLNSNTASATTQAGGGDPWVNLDGRLNAPSGAAQHPAILNSYHSSGFSNARYTLGGGGGRQPPWRVAGVDYAVGYPSGTTLKNPSTISVSGVSVTSSSVTITGANITLDGYDFSGRSVSIQGANARIINSRIAGSGSIFGNESASNMYVGYCVIDRQNSSAEVLIGTNGHGITVEYCWLLNAGEDSIQFHSGLTGAQGGPLVLRFNLFENGGQRWSEGAHGDFLQDLGGPFTMSIMFNTTYQNTGTTSGGFTQGLMMEPDGYGPWPPSITDGEYGYNTMIALGDFTQNFFIGVTVSTIVNQVTAHDNFFDPTGALGLSRGTSAKYVLTNNKNMTNGNIEN